MQGLHDAIKLVSALKVLRIMYTECLRVNDVFSKANGKEGKSLQTSFFKNPILLLI